MAILENRRSRGKQYQHSGFAFVLILLPSTFDFLVLPLRPLSMAGNIMQYDSMQWYSPVARSQSWHVGLCLAGQYCMAGNIM